MSEKRTDKSFLASLLTNSSTRFLLFSNLDPITNKSALAYVSYNDLKDVVDTEARKGRLWCFLGVDPEDMVQVDGNEIGRPYFCVDVTVEKGEKAEAPLEKVLSGRFVVGLAAFPRLSFVCLYSRCDARPQIRPLPNELFQAQSPRSKHRRPCSLDFGLEPEKRLLLLLRPSHRFRRRWIPPNLSAYDERKEVSGSQGCSEL